MDSKTIKRLACAVNRIPVKDFYSRCIQAHYARILTCQKLYEAGVAPYDIGKILGLETHKVSEYLDAYNNRMTTDAFFCSVNRNFYNKTNEYGTK